MATSPTPGQEGGFIITYILKEGAIKITKKFALKRISELKPAGWDADAWTVDAFLKENRKTLLESRKFRENEWKYLPKNSVTDIDKWDLNEIIFILTKICSLDKEMIMYLQQLRKMRNKIVHLTTFSLEMNKYQHYRTKVSVILKKILKEIGEEELKREFEHMNEQLDTGTIFSTRAEPEHQTHTEQRDGRETLEKQDTVGDETTVKKLNKTIQMLQRMEPVMPAHNRTIPEFKLPIKFRDCTEERNVELSQHMVEIFNDVVYRKYDDFQEQSNEFRHKMREAVYETCLTFLSKGRPIQNAEENCVLLHIKCISLVSLLILFRDYIDGILDKNIQGLQSAVRRCSGYEHTRLEVVVYKDDFWRILSKIAEDLDKYVSSKETSEQAHPANGKTHISSG